MYTSCLELEPWNVKASLRVLDGVFQADRLKVHEISRVASFDAIASCSPTMPARRCANIEPLGVGECCMLLLMYNGVLCVHGPHGTGDARKKLLPEVSRHLPTSQGLLCRPRSRKLPELHQRWEANCYRVCLETLVDNQCLGSAVHTAHLWSWD